MKKLYTFAAAALFAVAPLSAREFTFWLNNTQLKNGDKIVYNEIEREVITPVMENIMIQPPLYLTTDIMTKTLQITAKCVSGQSIQLCAGGSCDAGEEVTKKDITLQGSQRLPLEFDYVENERNPSDPIPTVVTEISAVDTKYPNTLTSITVTLNGDNAAVTDIFANDNDFRAVTGAIEYRFDVPTQVAIFNLAGETVLEATLNGEGSLNTTSLSKGVYAYKAGAKSGKIYIR
ncbi:MAG: T9SS type A sorting domain-containing protein [Muribaculaceae bacterium]|nr:T9SS type A sorting domain-containing protein [Muribaculaceae bacterium]